MQHPSSTRPTPVDSADSAHDPHAEPGAELDQALPPTDESFLDNLNRHLGKVPWWVVSGAFHAVILALFVLMMMEIPREAPVVTMVGTPETQPPVKVEDPTPPVPPKEFKNVEISLETVNPTEFTPIMVDPVPIEDKELTDNQENAQQAKGDPSKLANLEQNANGYSGLMGVGGGGMTGQHGEHGIGSMRRAVRKYNGPSGTIGTVTSGLKWLADHQEPDGHWDTVKYGAQENGRCDTAATGLAALAFLSAGQSDKRGEYRDTVKRALEWIIKQQNADGCIMPGANGKEASYGPGYHHAICGIALAEAYGLSKSDWLKTAAQKAVNYSVDKHQDGTGSDRLGWRYAPKSAGDISVTGWFIMQLKDARLCNLAVPQEAFQGGIAFLDSVEVKGDPNDPYSGHRYKYQAAKTDASPMQTLIGCTARMFLGWPKEEVEPAIQWAIEKKGLPSWGQNGENIDWYYMYYGTIVSFQVGGDVWDKWNKAFAPMLIERQRKDGDEKGSWDPTGHYANLGRVFSTANAVLSMEVYWRVSPLYSTSGRK